METLFFLVIAVSLAYAVGCWGRTRKIGFGLAFVLSLVNLLIGIVAVACSKKLENESEETNKLVEVGKKYIDEDKWEEWEHFVKTKTRNGYTNQVENILELLRMVDN